jgi:Cdc6-like AAA superfamily ATPase
MAIVQFGRVLDSVQTKPFQALDERVLSTDQLQLKRLVLGELIERQADFTKGIGSWCTIGIDKQDDLTRSFPDPTIASSRCCKRNLSMQSKGETQLFCNLDRRLTSVIDDDYLKRRSIHLAH